MQKLDVTKLPYYKLINAQIWNFCMMTFNVDDPCGLIQSLVSKRLFQHSQWILCLRTDFRHLTKRPIDFEMRESKVQIFDLRTISFALGVWKAKTQTSHLKKQQSALCSYRATAHCWEYRNACVCVCWVNDLRSSFGDPVELQQSSKLTAKLKKKKRQIVSVFFQAETSNMCGSSSWVCYLLYVCKWRVCGSVGLTKEAIRRRHFGLSWEFNILYTHSSKIISGLIDDEINH